MYVLYICTHIYISIDIWVCTCIWIELIHIHIHLHIHIHAYTWKVGLLQTSCPIRPHTIYMYACGYHCI